MSISRGENTNIIHDELKLKYGTPGIGRKRKVTEIFNIKRKIYTKKVSIFLIHK